MKTVLQIALLILAVAGLAVAEDEPVAVSPEIGAGGAVAAVGLLAGALFVMRTRRK